MPAVCIGTIEECIRFYNATKRLENRRSRFKEGKEQKEEHRTGEKKPQSQQRVTKWGQSQLQQQYIGLAETNSDEDRAEQSHKAFTCKSDKPREQWEQSSRVESHNSTSATVENGSESEARTSRTAQDDSYGGPTCSSTGRPECRRHDAEGTDQDGQGETAGGGKAAPGTTRIPQEGTGGDEKEQPNPQPQPGRHSTSQVEARASGEGGEEPAQGKAKAEPDTYLSKAGPQANTTAPTWVNRSGRCGMATRTSSKEPGKEEIHKEAIATAEIPKITLEGTLALSHITLEGAASLIGRDVPNRRAAQERTTAEE